MFDVLIIGGGVTGCSVARELSRYALKTCLLEKCPDVAMGTTKANSAIIHAGYDSVPGSLKAKMNVKGNAMFDRLSKELDFPFMRNGSLVVCFKDEDIPRLNELLARGRKNGVPGLSILGGGEVRAHNGYLSHNIRAALYAPTAGIVCPYEFALALAENACVNGVYFRLNTAVKEIRKENGCFSVFSENGEVFQSRVVINAAGLYADEINNMVSQRKIKITPRRGEYILFDKICGDRTDKTIFQLPTKMGKGVLVARTVDGNLLIGPNAQDIEDKTDVTTTREGLDAILSAAALTLEELPLRQEITSFAGLRAHSETDDFIIGEAPDAENFINAAGIESPGLSSAPAIGEAVAEMVAKKLKPLKNPAFNPVRKGIPKFRNMNNEERREIIARNPAYGRVVCRCETVTEGEIIEAIRRPLGARTMDGVKRRTRAGMGRCQSGFCTTRVMEILARERNIPYEEITKCGEGSELIEGRDKNL